MEKPISTPVARNVALQKSITDYLRRYSQVPGMRRTARIVHAFAKSASRDQIVAQLELMTDTGTIETNGFGRYQLADDPDDQLCEAV